MAELERRARKGKGKSTPVKHNETKTKPIEISVMNLNIGTSKYRVPAARRREILSDMSSTHLPDVIFVTECPGVKTKLPDIMGGSYRIHGNKQACLLFAKKTFRSDTISRVFPIGRDCLGDRLVCALVNGVMFAAWHGKHRAQKQIKHTEYAQLMEALHQLDTKHKPKAIFLAGDFNLDVSEVHLVSTSRDDSSIEHKEEGWEGIGETPSRNIDWILVRRAQFKPKTNRCIEINELDHTLRLITVCVK